MSLKLKILDERNTLTIIEKPEFRFFANEDRALRVQILDELDNQPRPILAGGTGNFKLCASPADLDLVGTIDGTDRSIISITLTQTHTLQMTGGNMLLEINEGGVRRTAKKAYGLKKLTKVDE